MRREGLFSILASAVVFIFIAYIMIAMFITIFPALVYLVLAALFVFGVVFVYRTIKKGIKDAVNPPPQYDEFGSRKTRSTVVDMTEGDDQEKKETKKEDEKK